MQPLQAPEAGAPFALLDDATSGGVPCSRWYTGYAGEFSGRPVCWMGWTTIFALRGARVCMR